MKKFLVLVFFCFLCSYVFAQNNVIETELQEAMNQRSDEMIDVSIMFKSQINATDLKAKAGRSDDKAIKREIVVSELKDFSSKTQSDVMSILEAEERSGRVADIRSIWIANVISCKASRDVIYKIASHPDVAVISYEKEHQLITPEMMQEMSENEASMTRGLAHHIVTVNADDVWAQGYTGKNVVVAVLDSGLNFEHKDIKNQLWEGYVNGELVNGWDVISNTSNIKDGFYHGTHCAGIVCGDGTSGTTTGVAPDARLMTVRVVGNMGTGSVAYMLSGVQFALENGADILSMSLGFKDNQITVAQKETIRATFDNLLTSGVIVCAAAGNDGTSWGAPHNVDYPAACPSPWRNPDQTLQGGVSSVICVGAHDLIGSSSQGPSSWEGTFYDDYPYNNGESMGLIRPDICAPGNFIYSLKHNSNNDYRMGSGTSQSTPCVAGVIALMLEKNANLTPAEITKIIETTAADKPQTKNNVVGSGRIDALAAIEAIKTTSSAPFIRFESAIKDNNTITITVKNEGDEATAANSTAVLSLINNPYVTIAQSEITIGEIAAGSTKEITFNISLAQNTPLGHTAFFNIATNSDDFTWKDKFSLKITEAPSLTFQSVSPSEINVGKDEIINVTVLNNGTVAMNGTASFTLHATQYDLGYISIVDGEDVISNVGAGETATASFTVNAGSQTSHNYSVDFFMGSVIEQNTAASYIYEFENDNQGWTCFDAAGNGIATPWWHSNNAVSHGKEAKDSYSGNGHLMSETRYNNTDYTYPINNYLVSPSKIEVTANSKITFYARAHHETYNLEHFGLAVSENSNTSANDFTLLKEWIIAESDGKNWVKYEYDLSEYAGKKVYVAVRHFFTQAQWEDPNFADYGRTNVDALNIDDIVLENVIIDIQQEPTYSQDDPNYFNVVIKNPIELPAPANFTVTRPEGSEGYSQISLQWDAVNKAKSYEIFRNDIRIATITTTSFNDTGLTHNTTYRYKVRALYNGIEGTFTDEKSVTTLHKDYSAAVECSPQTIDVDGATTVPLVLTIKNDGKYQFKARASYTLSTENDYVTITNNTDIINALTSGSSVEKTINVTVNENIPHGSVINFNLNLTSLDVNNVSGLYYTFDIPFEVAVENPLRAPENLAVKNQGANFIPLVWDAAYNATSYDIYRNGVKIANTSFTMYVDNGLEKETQYCYKVKSVKANEVSDFSDEICATTLAEDAGVVVQSFNLTENGEFATLTVTFINKTNATTEETSVTLLTEDSYVTIVNGTAAIAPIEAGKTATAEFSLKIDVSTPENHNMVFYTILGDYYGIIDVIPNLPSIVELTAEANGVDKANLSWDAVARAQCYSIYRDKKYITNTTATSYTDNNLTHNSDYCYKVAAVCDGIEYSHSEEVCIKTAQKDYSVIVETSPETVDIIGLTTVPINFTIFNDGKNEINAEYTLTSEDGNVIITDNTGYVKALQPEAEVTKTTEVKIKKDVPDGHVLVFNLNLLSMDIPFEIEVNNPSRVPENLLVGSSTDAYSLDLSWSEVTDATSYNIYRGSVFIGSTSTTTYTDKGLNANSGYCYKVTSMIGTVESDFSDEVCATTSTIDGKVIVQSFDITEVGSTVTLTATLVNNTAEATPEGTTATLACNDNYITIDNAIVEVGSIAVGETKTVEYTFELADNTPSNHSLDFNVIVESAAETSDLTYNFNSSDEGWYCLDWDGKNGNWEYKDYSFRSYSFYNNKAVTPDNLLISPQSVGITSGSKLIFNVSSISSDGEHHKEHYGIYVTETFPDEGWDYLLASSITSIYEETLDKAAVQTKEIDLSAYAGKNIWIMFRHWNCSDQYAIVIDNVEITNVSSGGGAGFAYTSSLTVTVNESTNIYTGTGSWATAANWSKSSVPETTDDVIVKGNVTIESGDVTVNSLVVYNEASLTINNGAKLTVNDSFVNTDKDFLIINDGAQVFQNEDNVAATFKMNMNNWNDVSSWQFISSPVKNANTADFAPENGYDLFKYDGTQELQWVNYKGHSTTDFETTFQQGRGYLASYQNETTATFSGILNHETSFLFSELKDYDEQDRFNNFYLLGNPFSFNMDWANVTAEYIYDGGFATINNGGSYEYHGANGSVNVGDGFMVLVTADEPSLSYGAAKRGNAKSESINLIATSNAGKDNLIISLDGAEDEGFNKLENFNKEIAEIYVANNGSRYAIMSYDQDVTEIPVSFDAKQMGNYTINAIANGKFSSVILVDRFTGIETNLLLEGYSFTATGSDNHDRFIVKLVNGQQTTADSNFAYVSGEDLILNIEGKVQIIDVMGRIVYANDVTSDNNRINVSAFDSAAYLIRVVNEEGVKTQKLIVNSL